MYVPAFWRRKEEAGERPDRLGLTAFNWGKSHDKLGIGNAHEIKSRQWSCKNCYQTEAKQSIKLKICWRFNLTLTHAAGTYYTHGIGLYRYCILYIRRADWLTDDDGDECELRGNWFLATSLPASTPSLFLPSFLPSTSCCSFGFFLAAPP